METQDVQVRSLEEVVASIASLGVRLATVEKRIGQAEDVLDLALTPPWRRLIYMLNGWPGWQAVQCYEQRWRPWHRWRGRRDR